MDESNIFSMMTKNFAKNIQEEIDDAKHLTCTHRKELDVNERTLFDCCHPKLI